MQLGGEDRGMRTVEGGDLGSLEDVGPGVALGGREEEVDFQVAQERDAEGGPRARDRVGGGDQAGRVVLVNGIARFVVSSSADPPPCVPTTIGLLLPTVNRGIGLTR